MDPAEIRKTALAVKNLLSKKKRKVTLTTSSSVFTPPPPIVAETRAEVPASQIPALAPITDPVVLSSEEETTPLREKPEESVLKKAVGGVTEKATDSAPVYSSNLDMASILRSPQTEEMSDSRSAAENVIREEQPLDRETAVPTASEIRKAGDLLMSEDTPTNTVPTAAEARFAEDLLNTLSETAPTTVIYADLNLPTSGEMETTIPTTSVVDPTTLIFSEGLELSIGVGRTTVGGEGTSQPSAASYADLLARNAELLASNAELLARLKTLEDSLCNLPTNVVGQASSSHNLCNFRLGQQHMYDMLIRRGFITPDAVSADVIMNIILWSMYL